MYSTTASTNSSKSASVGSALVSITKLCRCRAILGDRCCDVLRSNVRVLKHQMSPQHIATGRSVECFGVTAFALG